MTASTATRKVGKYGLCPTPHGVKWQLQFSSYVDAAKLPPIPVGDFGHTSLVKGDWGMMLNDQLGCCAVAGPQHCSMLWTAEAGGPQAVYDDACTIKNYELFGNYRPSNPNTDQGCDMITVAHRWMRTGLVDTSGNHHKIGVALELQPGNWEQLQYAMYYFDGVGLGIAVTSAMETEFANGQPWDGASFNPNDVQGGHFVPAVARKDGNAQVITWGEEQLITPSGYRAISSRQLGGQTFAYASLEKLKNGKDQEGLSWSEMRSGIRSLLQVR